MKLEQQVVSLELSKELKALGVPQESLFYWDNVRLSSNNPDWKINYYSNEGQGDISAFTVAELGEMLKGWVYEIRNSGGVWVITAVNPPSLDINNLPTYQTHSGETEADARAKMLCYLIS